MYGPKAGARSFMSYHAGLGISGTGFALPRVRKRISEFLTNSGMGTLQNELDTIPDRITPLFSFFIRAMDSRAGTLGWVEKTPNNLFCLDLIEKHVPNPVFIHVLRSGEEAIASIVDAAQRYDDWNARYLRTPGGIERLVALWNNAAAISIKRSRGKNHFLLRHEQLIADPEKEIKKVATFLGIPYEPDMLNPSADPYILPYESWKKNMGNAIKPQESKFSEVLSLKEQKYVRENLIDPDALIVTA